LNEPTEKPAHSNLFKEEFSMADYYYGVDKGKSIDSVTGGASTTSKVIELRVADTVLNKAEVIVALEALKSHLLSNVFPSA
jgi:hypothetical protein